MDRTDRLQRELRFPAEIDALKNVERQTTLTDRSRLENSAEHSWHIAVLAIILAEHADHKNLDLLKVVKMLLIHDIVEVDAGDTFCYAEGAENGKREREERAAERLFGLLPDDLSAQLNELWQEFEGQVTPEARYAAAMDRLQPVLQNLNSEGFAWRRHGIRREQVVARNRHIGAASSSLWSYVEGRLDEAEDKGWL